MTQNKLVFIGDSLIGYYDWKRRFPQNDVMNLGIPGETVGELLNRSHRIIDQAGHPDWLIIMSGTNNVCMEDYTFIPVYETIIHTFREALPDTAIAMNSLMPIKMPWLSQTAIPRMNSGLNELAQKTKSEFLDTFQLFTEAQSKEGSPLFLPDGVHLDERGYTVWSNALASILRD